MLEEALADEAAQVVGHLAGSVRAAQDFEHRILRTRAAPFRQTLLGINNGQTVIGDVPAAGVGLSVELVTD
jgi:hypothetical protein